MHWIGVNAHDTLKTVLALDGVGVVRLSQRVDGAWIAALDYHLPYPQWRTRDCTSLAAGRAGAERWALKHIARLLHESAIVRARTVMLPGRETGPRPPHNVRPSGWRKKGR